MFHVFVKISEICKFQYDVARLLTTKAAVAANNVRRGHSVVLEPSVAILLSLVVYLCLCSSIGLEYVGVLLLVISVLSSIRNIYRDGKDVDPTACSGVSGTNLSYSLSTTILYAMELPPSPIFSLDIIGRISSGLIWRSMPYSSVRAQNAHCFSWKAAQRSRWEDDGNSEGF